MSESSEQRELVKWFRETWPEYEKSLRVSMSGMNYGSGQRGAMLARHVKSQGVVKGEADIAIMLKRGTFGCMVIEDKSDEAMRGATAAQMEYIDYHRSIGNCAIITKGVDMAKLAIQQYMDLKGSE